jgi:hypothetical protein
MFCVLFWFLLIRSEIILNQLRVYFFVFVKWTKEFFFKWNSFVQVLLALTSQFCISKEGTNFIHSIFIRIIYNLFINLIKNTFLLAWAKEKSIFWHINYGGQLPAKPYLPFPWHYGLGRLIIQFLGRDSLMVNAFTCPKPGLTSADCGGAEKWT